ncbi:dephospho-CoA kinase [Stenotrophomonas sp.]|uniref:dephospho-CoA kinase n=1 Tax=Stenotrophomonas sp. TaxID=69392 RepID=UPI002FC6BC58
MARYLIGLTGGIAAGKSELSRRFEALGITVADADVAARAVVAPGSEGLARIVAHFGPGIVLADGQLDRATLRERIFASPQERQALEAITHPAIRTLLRATCEQAAGPYAMAAIPLLTEAGGRGQYPWLDRILVVDVPVAVQHARLLQRDGITAELADRMIAAQASREARLALADDVVANDGPPDHLQAQVEHLDRLYRTLAANRG